MLRYSLALWVTGLGLEATLLLRGARSGSLRRFPLFYSYIGYCFSSSLATLMVYLMRPEAYGTAHWFVYLITLLAEFAVLLEISDHIFAPYPIIRLLGRSIAVVICSLFFVFYILPSVLQARSRSALLLDFSLRTCLTKAVLIIVLAAMARYFRLRVDRNVAGLMAGFGLYLGVSMASFAAVQTFARTIYTEIFGLMLQVGSILCLAAWTATMWELQPASSSTLGPSETGGRTLEEFNFELVRFNNALVRLLKK